MTKEDIDREYKAKLWWLWFPPMWRNISAAMDAQRNIAHWEAELQRVRERTVGNARKGRKPGSKNKPKPVVVVGVTAPTIAIMTADKSEAA